MPAELEKMVSAIKAELKKKHPEWDDEKCSSSAWTIANAKWKEMHGDKKKESIKDGKIVVGENVKLIMESSLDSAEDMIEG